MDCNVLISAALTRGAAWEVFYCAIKEHNCFLSQGIITELEKTIRKPRFHLQVLDLEKTLQILIDTATLVVPAPLTISLPDPDDTIYLATAVAASADAIITGNQKDFPSELCGSVRILTPREFLQLQ